MNTQTEPTMLYGAVGTLITAAVPVLARTFGWTDDVAAEWQVLLLAAWTVVSMLVTFLVIRHNVFSPATHAKDVDQALHEQPPA